MKDTQVRVTCSNISARLAAIAALCKGKPEGFTPSEGEVAAINKANPPVKVERFYVGKESDVAAWEQFAVEFGPLMHPSQAVRFIINGFNTEGANAARPILRDEPISTENDKLAADAFIKRCADMKKPVGETREVSAETAAKRLAAAQGEAAKQFMTAIMNGDVSAVEVFKALQASKPSAEKAAKVALVFVQQGKAAALAAVK